MNAREVLNTVADALERYYLASNHLVGNQRECEKRFAQVARIRKLALEVANVPVSIKAV